MFAYLVVESIRYTSNVKKYLMRLFVFAVVMFAGNTIFRLVYQAKYGMLSANIRLLLSNNIFFTLALGALSICCICCGRQSTRGAQRGLYALSAACFLLGFFAGEWGSVILPFMLAQCFFRENKWIRFLCYGLIQIVALLLPFSEPLWFLVFPFMMLYNGKKGRQSDKSKYFFYLFYPIHLWIIAIINYLSGI